MGLFSKLLKQDIEIGAALSGKCIALAEVPDEAFSQGILGKGVAIVPNDGKICAPADGEISTLFSTGHAVALTTSEGVEILVHVGLDTVTLEGKPFTIRTENGASVKRGDLILEADLEAIKAAGLEVITPIVICNPDDFSSIECMTGKDVTKGETVMKVKK